MRHFTLFSTGTTYSASTPMSAAKKMAKTLLSGRKKKVKFTMSDTSFKKHYRYCATKSKDGINVTVDKSGSNKGKRQRGGGECEGTLEVVLTDNSNNLILLENIILIYNCTYHTLYNEEYGYLGVQKNENLYNVFIIPKNGLISNYVTEFLIDDNNYIYIKENETNVYLNIIEESYYNNNLLKLGHSMNPAENTIKVLEKSVFDLRQYEEKLLMEAEAAKAKAEAEEEAQMNKILNEEEEDPYETLMNEIVTEETNGDRTPGGKYKKQTKKPITRQVRVRKGKRSQSV